MALFSWRKKKKKIRQPGEEDQEMSFFDHLEELRWHIMRIVIMIIVIGGVLFTYRVEIIGGIFMSPFKEDFVTYRLLCEHITDQFCPEELTADEFLRMDQDSLELVGLMVMPRAQFEAQFGLSPSRLSADSVLSADSLPFPEGPIEVPITFKVDAKSFANSGQLAGFKIKSPSGELVSIQAISPYEQFMKSIVYAFFGALILGFPYVVFEIWLFVKPALAAKEVKKVRWNVLTVSLLFFLGVTFGYFIILPISIQFLSNFVLFEEAENIWRIGDVINFEMLLLFGAGLLFQMPLFIYYLSRIGLVSSGFLKKYRRHSVVGLLILSAFITPPDPMSQILIFVPLVILYEVGIVISKRVERRKAREEANLKQIN